MANKWADLILGVTVLLSGFYGGIGFFTIMGGNPAVEKLSSPSFAEYWKHIDGYMAARMPVFGSTLLLSALVSTMLLFNDRQSPSFWFMLLAFLVLAGDLIFVLSINHPLNRLIQSWDLNDLPANVEEIKFSVVRAFNIRTFFMITPFVLVLLSAWFRKAH